MAALNFRFDSGEGPNDYPDYEFVVAQTLLTIDHATEIEELDRPGWKDPELLRPIFSGIALVIGLALDWSDLETPATTFPAWPDRRWDKAVPRGWRH